MSTTNGTYADIYVISKKGITTNRNNTVAAVQINGQDMVEMLKLDKLLWH